MPGNRKKLIELFIGNISNAIAHEIILACVNEKEVASYYQEEVDNSMRISRAYREKINPVDRTFSKEDIEYIRNKISSRVMAELVSRVSKGYKIDFTLIDAFVEKSLKDCAVS